MNASEIFAVIVDRGSWHGVDEQLDADLPELRRQLRALAKDRGIRVLTRHAGGVFIAWWPEHQPTDLQQRATARVVRGLFTEDAVTYDEALEQERRAQIRAV